MENDICIVTNDMDTLSIVHGLTDVDLRSSEGTWLDRFKAFLSGDEPVQVAFSHMGFTEEESFHYYDEVTNGGFLLYVDQEFANLNKSRHAEFPLGYTDPNIGSNLTVNYNTTMNHD